MIPFLNIFYRSIKQIINKNIDGEYFVGYINKFGS